MIRAPKTTVLINYSNSKLTVPRERGKIDSSVKNVILSLPDRKTVDSVTSFPFTKVRLFLQGIIFTKPNKRARDDSLSFTKTGTVN